MKSNENKSVKPQHLVAVALATAVTLPGMAILAEEVEQNSVEQDVVQQTENTEFARITDTTFYEEESVGEEDPNVNQFNESEKISDEEDLFAGESVDYNIENQEKENLNNDFKAPDSETEVEPKKEILNSEVTTFPKENSEMKAFASEENKDVQSKEMEVIEETKPQNNSIFQFGDGSEENPYQVSTAEQLDAVRNDLTAHYIQTADIDLAGINWKSIGDESTHYRDMAYNYGLRKLTFSGVYDGNNFSIKNLNIARKTDETSIIGLFSYVHKAGVVKNIHFDNAKVVYTHIKYPSMTVTGTVAGINYGRIENITCEGQVDGGTYISSNLYKYAGGIAGENHGTINICHIYGLNSEVKGSRVGGISGVNYGDINDCLVENINVISIYNVGQWSNSVYAGGITGVNSGSIKYCISDAKIKVQSGNKGYLYAGGISGCAGHLAKHEYCYNRSFSSVDRTQMGGASAGLIPSISFKGADYGKCQFICCESEGNKFYDKFDYNRIDFKPFSGTKNELIYIIYSHLKENGIEPTKFTEYQLNLREGEGIIAIESYDSESVYGYGYYKKRNSEDIDSLLDKILIKSDNDDIVSIQKTEINILSEDIGLFKIKFSGKNINPGETHLSLLKNSDIITKIPVKVNLHFNLSKHTLFMENEEQVVYIYAESPYLTEAMANEVLEKMDWSVKAWSGIGAANIRMDKEFKDGKITIRFTVSPYFDSSLDSKATVTVKNLNLRDITFDIHQKGFLSAYDQLLMEAVSQYTNPNQFMDEMNRIMSDTSIPEKERWEKYVEYLSSCGILNAKEGVAWSKDAYEASRQLAYLTNNDLWLYSIYDDFLRNDPKGQAMIVLLYANNLIIGGEYKDYIKPTTYIKFETPEIKKYKTLLYKFMKETSQTNYRETAISEYAKIVGALDKMTGKEFYDSVLDLYYSSSNQEVFDSLMSTYVNKYLGNVSLVNKTGNHLLDTLHGQLKLAGDGMKILKLSSEALNYVTRTSAMAKVYEDYIGFFDTIMRGDDQLVPDTLKIAAFQVQYECTELLNGYLAKLGGMATDLLVDELTDELMNELLKDLTATLDLGATIANWLSGYTEFSNQVTYIQGYASLSNLYASKIQSTVEAYRSNPSAELAHQFYEEFNYLKLLREKGEEGYRTLCYKDNAVVKKVIGALQSTQPWYKERRNMMDENIQYAQNAVFIFSDTASTVSSRKTYQNKVVVQCPVDIEVYKDGKLLFTIKDGEEMDVSNEYGRFVSLKRTFGEDYAKAIYLDDPDCYIKVIGAENGVVTISHVQNGEDGITTFVSDYNPVSKKSTLVYELSDPKKALKLDYDGDGNVDEITTLYPVSQEVVLPNEIKVSNEKATLKQGEKLVLGLDILPFNTTNKEVKWESLDPSIVEVKNGVLTAITLGETRIVITTLDGKIKKEVEVVVESTNQQKPPVDDPNEKPDKPTEKPSTKPEDPENKPSDKPIVPNEKPTDQNKPSAPEKPSENKPMTPDDEANKPVEKPSTKPEDPGNKPSDKPIVPNEKPTDQNKPSDPEKPSENKPMTPVDEANKPVVTPSVKDDSSFKEETVNLANRKVVKVDSVSTTRSPETGFAMKKSNSLFAGLMTVVGLGWIVSRKRKEKR